MSVLKGPWSHRFLTTNGVKLHYVTQGQGKLILFLHGFPEFWYSWRYQIPEFAQQYQTVALDLRGYNESDKPQNVEAYRVGELVRDLQGVLEALKKKDCILIGHDWGGAIAWHFAEAYPEKVEKLLILNAPHPAKLKEHLRTNPQQWLRSAYLAFFQLPFLPEWLLQWQDYEAISLILREMATNKKAFTPADLAAYKDAAAKPGALTAMLNYYRNLWGELAQDKKWSKLTVPTRVIWGKNDPFLGKELTEKLEVYAENIRVDYLPESSHWVQQEQPQLVNQLIWDFLAS